MPKIRYSDRWAKQMKRERRHVKKLQKLADMLL